MCAQPTPWRKLREGTTRDPITPVPTACKEYFHKLRQDNSNFDRITQKQSIVCTFQPESLAMPYKKRSAFKMGALKYSTCQVPRVNPTPYTMTTRGANNKDTMHKLPQGCHMTSCLDWPTRCQRIDGARMVLHCSRAAPLYGDLDCCPSRGKCTALWQ